MSPWRIILHCCLLVLLGTGVLAQPLQSLPRTDCVPGAKCAVGGRPGPACRPCCQPAKPTPVLRPNCCILTKGVPTEVQSDRQVIVAAIVHAPPPALTTIQADAPRHFHLIEDDVTWTPPWAVAPEQGRAARPPPAA